MTSADWISLYANLALIALVDAMSPVRVAVILVLLSGSRPVWRALAFMVGIGVFNLLLALLINQSTTILPTYEFELGPMGLVIQFLLGVGLLIFAVRTWRTAPAAPATGDQSSEVKMPDFVKRFTDRILNGGIALVFVGGMVMQIFSVKSLILFSAGLKKILEANLPPTSALITLLFFIVFDLIEMIVPTVMFAASPDNSARLLSQMSQWLLHYSYPILAIAEGALAIYFIAESIAQALH